MIGCVGGCISWLKKMTKTRSLGLLLSAVFLPLLFSQSVPISSVPGLSASLPAASACTGKTNLLCAIPNVFGPYGLVLPHPGVSPSFASSFQTDFAATATQLTLLPLANPASGFVYEYDAQTGLYSRTSQSLGPVVTERGETIGRHKFYIGGTYQRFRFSKLDGVDLHNIPALLPAVPSSVPAGDPYLAGEFISTQNSIDIKLNQFTIFGTFGLTNRIDLSIAVPFMQAAFNVNSVATINRVVGTEPIVIPGATGQPVVTCCSNGGPGPYGPVFASYFNPANPAGSTVREFSNNQSTSAGDLYWDPSKNSAQGIGDITFRLKANLYHDDRLSFAILTDVRAPTGDATNFLGSGTVGFKPVAALSVRAGFLTPHVNLGYQWNGSSILGGDPYLGTKGRLPGFAIFSAGSDIPVSKYITLSADYLGQELVNSLRISTATYTSPGPLASTGQVESFQTIVPQANQVYNQSDAAIGLKISAFDRLLFTANAIVALNRAGLRQKVTPFVAVSYVF
jgi:hypothetical protein